MDVKKFAKVVGSPRPLISRVKPFDEETLFGSFNPQNQYYVDIKPTSELYELVSEYIVSTDSPSSFIFDVGSKSSTCDVSDSEDEDDCVKQEGRGTVKKLGLGLFDFQWKDHTIRALHQTIGEPVGTNCGPSMFTNLVIFNDSQKTLVSFCDELIAKADKTSGNKFTIWRFHSRHHYWMKVETVVARPTTSVVLPENTKKRIVDDMKDFLSSETKKWYMEHGIPWKRSYLFFGKPGAGKTSMINSLAGQFRRNVCYLSACHPEMTDDAIKNAAQRVPRNSIIVLEDVDALFEEKTRKARASSPLTFSGLLNALDGVGGVSGQIFVLTTNHRERLDPALIRNGRVDVHIEFHEATSEQMREIFKQFYPESSDTIATEFQQNLEELLKEQKVSMAALQHYFILKRKATAKEAATGVELVLEELKAHGNLDTTSEKTKLKKCDDSESGSGDDSDVDEQNNKTDESDSSLQKGEGLHVHVHLNK